MRRLAGGAFLATALCSSAGGAGLRVTPVYSASLMAGQYFFGTDRSGLSANAALTAAPALSAGGAWTFLPVYSGSYQGTKGVSDAVGSGSLFQQQMDHRVSFTAVRALGTWRLKPSASYKRQFLKETRDESWGRGLFDYEKIGVGFEAENMYREPFSYRLGLDVFRIKFPRYISLESKSGVDPSGNPLGRELSDRRVLDTLNIQASASVAAPYPAEDPKFVLQAALSTLRQGFEDQHIVNTRGQLNRESRSDMLQSASASISSPRPLRLGGEEAVLEPAFGVNAAVNHSDQNTYDAARTQFVANSYSYFSWGAGPSLALSWGERKNPARASLAFRYSSTNYFGRLAQDGAGIYTSDLQWQDRYLVSAGYSYPISPGFRLRAEANSLWARSNQNYQKTYAYNYRTVNYLMGFTYDY